MAKKKQGKDITAWTRFRLWVDNNQKVVWVLLLLIISPLFAFPVGSFMGSPEAKITIDEVYGEPISQADLKGTLTALGVVSAATGRLAHGLIQGDPLAFHVFREKARRMGLRVSDEELADRVRDIWQWVEAGRLAQAELESRPPPDSKDPSAGFMRQMEMRELAEKKKKELEAARAFDGAAWGMIVQDMSRRARGGLRVKDFEETLRDVYLIAKLEDSVRSAVAVTPEEAYEKYRRDSQTRKLSWTEIEANDALKEAASRAVTAEEVKAHYDAHAAELEKAVAIRAEWLLVPLEHFKEKAAAEITEEDLKKHYEENASQYRRPTILADEHSFTLRSREETEKLRKAAYKSFEDVKEKVREDAVATRSQRELSAFAGGLRTRLRPEKAATEEETKAPAASFVSLAKELPFLRTGESDFVSREEAQDAFGDAYTTQVSSWFARADSTTQRGSIEAPEHPLQAEKGMVFYGKPEVRRRFRPTLKDVEAKVREELVASKAARWIADALAAPLEELNEGKRTLEEIAAAGIDVEPGSPTDPAAAPADPAPGTIHLAASPVRTSGIHVSRSGPLMVPAQGEEAGKEETEDSAGEEKEKEEVAHPASTEIILAAFGIEKTGQAAVARHDEEAAAYVVRFDDLIYPDAAGFAARKESIEGEILRSKQEAHLTAWRNQVLQEARGRLVASGGGAPENPEAPAAPPGTAP